MRSVSSGSTRLARKPSSGFGSGQTVEIIPANWSRVRYPYDFESNCLNSSLWVPHPTTTTHARKQEQNVGVGGDVGVINPCRTGGGMEGRNREKERCTGTHSHTGRRTDRQTDRQTGKQTHSSHLYLLCVCVCVCACACVCVCVCVRACVRVFVSA